MSISAGSVFSINVDGRHALNAGLMDINNAVAVYREGNTNIANVVQDDETVGADYSFTGFSQGSVFGTIAVAGLTSTTAITAWSKQGNGARVDILSRSGTTLTTPGGEIDLGGGDPHGIAVVALSATAAIATWNHDSVNDEGEANYLTISGTSITDESIVTYESSAGNGVGLVVALCKLTSTKGVVVYRDEDDSNQLKARVLSVSGTTISAGAAATIDAGDAGEFPALAEISTTSCLLVYRNVTDSDVKSVVLSGMSGTTVTVNTPIVVDSSDGDAISVAGFSTTQFVATYVRTSTNSGRMIELAVAGVVVSTVGADSEFASGVESTSVVAFSTTKMFSFFDDTDASGVMITLSSSSSHIWLSTNGGASYSNIGDSATWGSDVAGGVVIVPGTAYQTIFAAVGTDLYKSVNGGTAWTLETAIGYEVDFIDLEKDNTTVFLAKRDAAGTNRASLWDGAVLTHINTGKSTTGGATSGGDVV